MIARWLICLSIVLSVFSLGHKSTFAQTSTPGFPPLGSAFEPRHGISTDVEHVLIDYANALETGDHLAASNAADLILQHQAAYLNFNPAEQIEILDEFVGVYILARRFDTAIQILNQLIDMTDPRLSQWSDGDRAVMELRRADWFQVLGNVYMRSSRFEDAYYSYTETQLIRSGIAEFSDEHPDQKYILDQKLAAARSGNFPYEFYCELSEEFNAFYMRQRIAIEFPFWGPYFGQSCPARTTEYHGGSGYSGGSETSKPSYYDVTISYGSSRKPKSSINKPEKYFGSDRGDLTLGQIHMTVPVDREPGALKARGLIHVFKPKEHVHIVLKRINPIETRTQFQSRLTEQINKGTNGRKEAFVYIHGHSVQFADAARRTAQLAVDLDMANGGIFYAWPTGSSPLSYRRSQANKEFAARHFEEFLKIVAQVNEIDELHLIAHSMGNEVLSQALENIDLRGYTRKQPPFGQIFWASPDVESETFAARASKIKSKKVANNMTLYASENDRALSVSKRFWTGFQRAGQAPPSASIASLLDTIDTTNADRDRLDVLGHTDYAKATLDDMRAVIWYSLMPTERCSLKQQSVSGTDYWSADTNASNCNANSFRTWLTEGRERNMDRNAFMGRMRLNGVRLASARRQ